MNTFKTFANFAGFVLGTMTTSPVKERKTNCPASDVQGALRIVLSE
jgi:hypothetical protein